MHRKISGNRQGFTLIELMVVMGIFAFLFALGVAMLPSIYQKWESAQGGQIVQGALARARQEARRSNRPSGVRLLTEQKFGKTASLKLQFIQQPMDLTGVTPSAVAANSPTLPISGNTTNLKADSVEIGGSGLPHGIKTPGSTLTLLNPLPNAVPAGSAFRIIRQPQPIQGEKQVTLPEDI